MNQIKRIKDIFWFIVLEVSVHGQLAYCFGSFSEAGHHGGDTWQRRSINLIVTGKQKKELCGG
jgi:ketosteroid isomerase-like protein